VKAAQIELSAGKHRRQPLRIERHVLARMQKQRFEQLLLVCLQFVRWKAFRFRENIAELKDHFIFAVHDRRAVP